MTKIKSKKVPNEVLPFIRNMGSFEFSTRQTAVSDLKAYLQTPQIPFKVFTHESFLAIWKGLYDCMLRQAEPLLQEKLADDICSVIYVLKKPKSANLFMQTGIETLLREWTRVNRFMRNKMMMLFRRLFRHALFRLAKYHWEYQRDFVTMLDSAIINPKSKSASDVPLEARFHFADLYLEEIAKSKDHLLNEEKVAIFIEPYINVFNHGDEHDYTNHVKSSIFSYLMTQSDAGIENRADLLADEVVIDKTTNKRTKNATGVYEIDKLNAVSNEDSEDDGEDSEEDAEIDEDGADIDEEDSDMGEEDADIDEEDSDIDENFDKDDDDDGMECSDDDDNFGSSYPLDPRAGNVDVILPQLDVDYKKLSTRIHSMSLDASPKSHRQLLSKLAQQLFAITEGQYSMGTHPSLRPEVKKHNDKELAKQMHDSAIERGIHVREECSKAELHPDIVKEINDFKTEKYRSMNAKKLLVKEKQRKRLKAKGIKFGRKPSYRKK